MTPGARGYRWVVLTAFMAVNLTIQTLWISYAPVSNQAEELYGVSDVAVAAFAMSFMVAYLPVSLPASYLIDHRGLRFAAGLGALLAGVAGVARGLAGDHYAAALLATAGAAIAQPFLLNAWTTLSTRWFPRSQRATAVSLITLANLLGTGIGVAATPSLVEATSIPRTQLLYGVAALVSGVVFVLVARDRPPVRPDAGSDDAHALVVHGIGRVLRIRPFLVLLVLAFVALGVFNGITTWVEEIVAPRGFTPDDAGTLGALLLVGGVLGAVVLSGWSDRAARRVPFLALGLAATAPGVVWLALAGSRPGLFASAALVGFFLTSVMPVGMQYAAEITAPAPEGTSNGLVQLAGQASVVFVLLMGVTRTDDGSFTPSLVGLAVMLVVGGLLAARLPEPAHHLRLRTAPLASELDHQPRT
ncbi:MFS transporter [Nocardioides caldifontis]|uniref:MFS transporter n=1 Tax=Nocardioides caldifontis TaxID=2588938 RepID=UPI0011DFB935|nr:MFS transporter [Nocardioides caldifontis]